MSEDCIKNILNKYNIIDEQEIKAVHLYCYWILNVKRIFPDMVHGKFNEEKDPRESLIFKHCYKLQRESTLEQKDYENYIKAQLLVLKHFSKKDENVNVDITCINGEKAWKRWKLFQSKYNKSKNDSVFKYVPLPNTCKLEKEFILTKEFLIDKIGSISENNLKENLDNIRFWFNLRKISPYFIVFNRYINKLYSTEDIRNFFKIDPILYKERINDKIKELYIKVFKETPYLGAKNGISK